MFNNCDKYNDEDDDADAYHDSGDSDAVGEEEEKNGRCLVVVIWNGDGDNTIGYIISWWLQRF